MKKVLLTIFALLFVLSFSKAQMVSTIAGSVGISGSSNGIGSSSRFNNPHGIAADKAGNIYITDRYNNKIRKITPAGVVSTLAGTGSIGATDGIGSLATFNEPWGITCDTLGNIFIADTKNYKIRKIDSSGIVSTVAGTGLFGTTNGANNVAKFGFSSGITVTRDGTIIYVADYNTHIIRKIFNGQVTTFAGTIYVAGATNGLGLAATFNHPYGIELDNNENILVADEWNNILRKITPLGMVSTFAGQGIVGSINGTALTSQFNYPWDITVDSLNNIYILDGYNFTIRKIATSGSVSTYVGTPGVSGSADGSGPAAMFNNAAGICYNRADKCLYVADCNNHLIRKVSSQSNIAITLSCTSASSICFGDSIFLNALPSGLTNYTIKEGSVVVGSSTNGVIVLTPLSAGSHNLICTAFDVNGSTASSNILTISIAPNFVPTIISNNGNSFCIGDSLRLTAQSGTAYKWSNGNTTQSIYVSTAGSFSVTVTNTNGCKGNSPSFGITVLPAPISSITSLGSMVCPGDSMLLTASTGSSWKWSNAATTQSILAPPGAYSVIVTNAAGCSARSIISTISNYIVSIPIISPNGILTIIQGDSVLLNVTGGINYQWSNNATGNAIYIKSSGTYYVSSTSNNGCISKSIAVQVIVISKSSIITANGITSFCDGNNVTLSSIFPTGNQWYFNGQVINGANNQQHVATDSGFYYVGVSQTNGIVYSDSILVSVLATPQLASVSDTSACVGSILDIQLTPQNGDFYSWFNVQSGGASIVVADNFRTPPITSAIAYYIESIGANGCRSINRATLNILPLPTPFSNFTTVTTPQSGFFPTSFLNNTTNADTYTWIFGDTIILGNISHDLNPVFNYGVVGNYTVKLISINQNGCIDSLTKTVNVHSNNSLFIPTTFTPNGDGKNDLFRVRGDLFSLQQMKIYDQWGTLIYITDASKPDWDGKVNGESVQNGTYVYRISIIDENNTPKELTGSISLIK